MALADLSERHAVRFGQSSKLKGNFASNIARKPREVVTSKATASDLLSLCEQVRGNEAGEVFYLYLSSYLWQESALGRARGMSMAQSFETMRFAAVTYRLRTADLRTRSTESVHRRTRQWPARRRCGRSG